LVRVACAHAWDRRKRSRATSRPTPGGPTSNRRAETLLTGRRELAGERFERHRGNGDIVRQDLIAKRGLFVSLRTIERAVAPYRRALAGQARATMRFETAPGKQLQIDFGERLVEIADAKVKVFLLSPPLVTHVDCTFGHSATSTRRAGLRAWRAPSRRTSMSGRGKWPTSAFTT
jgi:hypothetical protein